MTLKVIECLKVNLIDLNKRSMTWTCRLTFSASKHFSCIHLLYLLSTCFFYLECIDEFSLKTIFISSKFLFVKRFKWSTWQHYWKKLILTGLTRFSSSATPTDWRSELSNWHFQRAQFWKTTKFARKKEDTTFR